MVYSGRQSNQRHHRGDQYRSRYCTSEQPATQTIKIVAASRLPHEIPRWSSRKTTYIPLSGCYIIGYPSSDYDRIAAPKLRCAKVVIANQATTANEIQVIRKIYR